MKNNIGTRADFNRTINRLQRFSRRGSEKIVNVQGTNLTKYELNELRIAVRRSNMIKREERKAIENQLLRSRGESVGYTVGMGDIDLNALRERNLNLKNKSRSEINKYYNSFQEMASDKYYEGIKENYKNNYIRGFERTFNGMPYYNEFLKELEGLSPDTFVNLYYTDTEGSIDFFYDEAERNQRYIEVIGVWNEYLSNDLREILNNNLL